MIKDKELKLIKKQENTYVYNIDACEVYRAMTEDIFNRDNKLINAKGNYLSKNIKSNSLFTATIPYSLEMIRLDCYFPKEIYELNNKQYTKSIINITFNENYFVWRDALNKNGDSIRKKVLIANKKKIRKYLYSNGFYIDGEKYIFYKRGASKARTGSCLFIKENMYKTLMDRSRLIHNSSKYGLYFKDGEECDITSLNAYQSLILSGLEDIVEIPKESILIIDDIYSKPFKVISSVTREENGAIQTEIEEVVRTNNMTDGQGLLDESIFDVADRGNKGMMLLRSDLFKCCAFNTKLKQFFEHMNKEGYIKDNKIKDKYRGWVDYRDIKLVTTPSSVKYLKFKNKFNSEVDCYLSWFNNIDNTFGIVKSDKSGNYGTWNRTTYQIINSMPFSKEQIKELLKDELEYIHLLKTNLSYFKNHIAIKEEITKQIEGEIDSLDWNTGEALEYTSGDMISNILAINSDFQYTQLFKKYRNNQIDCYMNELRKGKIRLKDTIYSTIVANPYEMLLSTIGIFNGETLAKGYEIYSKYYKNNQKLATFRNPHINSGNVMLATNIYHEEYKWFNLSKNITIINVSDNDFPDRGQGFDFDSDTLLHIPNTIFIDVAEKCQAYKTPLNLVKGDSKIRHNTPTDLAELDDTLSNNFIGKIINKSQIINSYMWDCKAKGMSFDLADRLYSISSMLSSLSQIELDKAKKSFDNISMAKELKNINDMKFKDEQVIKFKTETQIDLKSGNEKKCKKMIVPLFFQYVAQDNTYRKLIKFETPMDYLQEILDESKKRTPKKNKSFGDLMVKANTLNGGFNNTKQQQEIYNTVNDCNKKINFVLMSKNKIPEDVGYNIINKSKEEALNKLNLMKINTKTIYAIFNKCFGENRKNNNYSKIGMLMLSMLYKTNTIKVLSIFKNENNMNEKILVKNKNGEIDIFGVKYSIIERHEIVK